MKFRTVFDGELVKNHEMPAMTLGLAISYLGELLQEASHVLNHNDVKPYVTVNASFKAGSFGVDFFYGFLDKAQMTLGILKNYKVDEILKFIGLLAGSTTSLIALIKWLNGRRVTKVAYNDDNTINIYKGEAFLKVEREVLELYENHAIRKHCHKFFKETLATEGLDTIGFTFDEGKTFTAEVNKLDALDFDIRKFERDDPVNNVFTRQAMYWHQVQFNDAKTGNRAFIDKLEKQPLKVMFEDNAIKKAMFASGERFNKPWHELVFIVDVEVIYVKGKPKIYNVKSFYDDETFDPDYED